MLGTATLDIAEATCEVLDMCTWKNVSVLRRKAKTSDFKLVLEYGTLHLSSIDDEKWFLTVDTWGIDMHLLEAKSVEDAKVEAVPHVIGHLSAFLDELKDHK